MRIAGLDVATTTGLARVGDDGNVVAQTFRPRAKRPFELAKHELSYEHEGAVLAEYRDFLRAWLVANAIEAVGIEAPLRSNVTFKKTVVNMNAGFYGQAITHEDKGGTTQATIYRLYTLHGETVEICRRLNIKIHVVNQSEWRHSFFGQLSPPRGCEDKGKWWKAQARRVCNLQKIDVPNDDAAEAVGILFHTRALLNPRMPARHDDLFRTTA